MATAATAIAGSSIGSSGIAALIIRWFQKSK
jgi:hypothetical protein